MSFGYLVAVEGIPELEEMSEIPQKLSRYAAMAVNRTARDYRVRGSRLIREEVAFPASYLYPSAGNLTVSRQATPDDLEAEISGRFRPTALSRFVKGPKTHGRKSPTVEVRPGSRQKMHRAFLMNLRNGNVGLAVRLAPNERVENKRRMVQVSAGLYLLYGPSVDQVFRSVSESMAPDAADSLHREFLRLAEADL